MKIKMSQENREVNDKRAYMIPFIVYVVICIFMGLFCWQYYVHLQSTIKEESKAHLQETSQHIARNASRTLTDIFSVLGTISAVLKNSQVEGFDEIEVIVREQQNYWNYQRIFLVDEDGIAYMADGGRITLTGDSYLRDVIVSQKRSMSAAQVVDNKECIVFTIPVDGLTVGDKKIKALAAAYDLVTFDRILSMTAFNGQGYAHIIRKDGAMAIRSSVSSAKEMGYNVLTTLSEALFENGNNMETIKLDIQEGRSGQVMYTMDNQRMYMVYTSLETQEWCLITFVPAKVVNANTNMMIWATLALCGFMTLAFAGLIAFLVKSFRTYNKKLEQIAYVDPVTKGNTIQRFYDLAGTLLKNTNNTQYALIFTNVEKFKVFNEQFGRRTCDEMLICIQQGIAQDLSEQEILGRIFADNFCVLVVYEQEKQMVSRFETWYENARRGAERNGAVWLMPTMEFGVYVVSNDTIPFPHMIDRAKLALREKSQELYGKMRYAIYDDAIRKRLFREKHLEDIMEQALHEHEFIVYLQPKYLVEHEIIGGAEALVRWQSKSEGMIFPDEFISLFEKNGFIVPMDLWVFEQVCHMIRRWMDQGLNPIKVSVNCSRVHLKSPDFLRKYIDICQRVNVPSKYLEIELTENIVFQDVERLSAIIDSIHEAGFGCSMDDFGSGYSSLNMIQDIPVDTIKMDRIFFKSVNRDINRMESVVGSIIAMSKSLSLEVVAEGVEEQSQVDMLKRLGCNYIQGFYYAKPMPVADFEKLAFQKEKDGAEC